MSSKAVFSAKSIMDKLMTCTTYGDSKMEFSSLSDIVTNDCDGIKLVSAMVRLLKILAILAFNFRFGCCDGSLKIGKFNQSHWKILENLCRFFWKNFETCLEKFLGNICLVQWMKLMIMTNFCSKRDFAWNRANWAAGADFVNFEGN